MSDRETTTTTIEKHTFTHYTYATAREMNTIQKAYFAGAKIEINGETPKIEEFDPSVQYNVQVEMIKQLVVKMDDVAGAEKIAEEVQNLPDHIFQELATKLDALVAKKKN